MTNEEELQHKQVQATYLRKLLKRAYEEIAELEQQADPYAELKAAHAAGKRIAVMTIDKSKSAYVYIAKPQWDAPVKDYKIVEDDEVDNLVIHLQKLNQRVEVRFTKCALTGKISAEVVE